MVGNNHPNRSGSIYAQHAAAFDNVSAYVVLKDGERVATVAFKFPRDGAGRLYAYVHWLGLPMVRGFASGGGYDKRSAACSAAVSKEQPIPAEWSADYNAPVREAFFAFSGAMVKDDGYSWVQNLEKAGFTVLQAV